MRFIPMIKSLLDTDLYKFNMGQVIFMRYPDVKMKWAFKCRNTDVFFTHEMIEEIREQVKHFCSLTFKTGDIKYLEEYPWLKKGYLNYLRTWKPDYDRIIIREDPDTPCNLTIEAEGLWTDTTMMEVPVLAIVNEVYFRMAYDYGDLMESFKERLYEKAEKLRTGEYTIGPFSEFGTRRRLSFEAQILAVKELYAMNNESTEKCGSLFVGTSNVHIARLMEMNGISHDLAKGTIAHEFMMAMQGIHRDDLAHGNLYAMNAWVAEYGAQNGIALTDTLGTEAFLLDFGPRFASLFTGVRHDSGDPYKWGELILAHYKKLGIDPKTKTLLFSDSLNFERADRIFRHFSGQCHVAFGIGTYLANDTVAEPLNIVMKAVEVNGLPVAKISDTQGKGMCRDDNYVKKLNADLKVALKRRETKNVQTAG